MFATVDDVATRIGRDLSATEQAQGTAVITTVSGLITDAAGKDAQWAADLDPVPAYFRALCVEKAVGAIANPENLAAESEQLGAHQYARTYPRHLDSGVFLTAEERRQVRREARVPGSVSVRAASIADELWPAETT